MVTTIICLSIAVILLITMLFNHASNEIDYIKELEKSDNTIKKQKTEIFELDKYTIRIQKQYNNLKEDYEKEVYELKQKHNNLSEEKANLLNLHAEAVNELTEKSKLIDTIFSLRPLQFDELKTMLYEEANSNNIKTLLSELNTKIITHTIELIKKEKK